MTPEIKAIPVTLNQKIFSFVFLADFEQVIDLDF